MRSSYTVACAICLMSLFLMPPVAAASEPFSEHYYSDSTVWLEPQHVTEATQGPYANAAHPQDGGLFKLPIIGRLTSAGIRISSARSNFSGLSQQAIFADFRTPWAWSTWGGTNTTLRLSLEVGRFLKASERRYFVSLGPNVRIVNDRWRVPLFIDLGLSPTVLDGSTYGDQDLGTSLYFTSHIGLGLKFGRTRRQEIRLRYQHISNGGFDDANPGVNLIGLDFVFWGRGY